MRHMRKVSVTTPDWVFSRPSDNEALDLLRVALVDACIAEADVISVSLELEILERELSTRYRKTASAIVWSGQ